MAESETHLAGPVTTWQGRWMRQRCAWCGVVLLDYDLERTASLDGEPPASWPDGALVVTSGAMSQVVEPRRSVEDPEVLIPPDDCCMRLDPAITT